MKFTASMLLRIASLLVAMGSTGVCAQTAAERAVTTAQEFSGTEITIVWETGLQSLDPLNFSGPKWRELTGIDVKVIEVATADMFNKIITEHRAGTGAYDVLNIIPAWLPDLAIAGALEPLDPFVEKYEYLDELKEIAPAYRDNQMSYDGIIYGFPDDGDVFLLYYRKDIFEENDLQPPETWAEFSEIGQMLTDKYAPEVYGAALFREPLYTQYMFQERFRVEGGRFFEPNSMKATVNSEVGVDVLTGMLEENRFMPPGVETTGVNENLATFLAGNSAMTISWPSYGRWAAAYGTDEDALSWVPKSTIVGKVGYALPPGGHPQLATGFSLSVSSSSQNKEAAYLFIQWLNSQQTSLERVQLPYALRHPFRNSHFASDEYKSRWPDAEAYLAALKQGAISGLLSLSLLQTESYEEALRQGIGRLWEGDDPQEILDDVAATWDRNTSRIGTDRQRAVYLDWAAKANAYPR